MNVQTELQPVDFSFFHKNKTLWGNKATFYTKCSENTRRASGDWYACNKHEWAGSVSQCRMVLSDTSFAPR